MNGLINISEATAIGLHAMILLANEKEPVPASFIADKLGVSKHHLSKVLRNLVEAGLLGSIKGPHGGFKLSGKQQSTSFMQVLQAIEGKLRTKDCLFNNKPCAKKKCILGSLICQFNKEFKDYFNNTKIMDFKETK